MSEDPNAFLMTGGGSPVAKFPSVGTVVQGTVAHFRVTQQTDIDQKAKFYDDGNPMLQLEITVTTDDRDPDVPNDKGDRRIFAKGQMKWAVADAVRSAGRDGLEAGGKLAIKYIGDAPSQKRGYSPAKQYEAAYEPPAVSATASNASESYFGDEEPF